MIVTITKENSDNFKGLVPNNILLQIGKEKDSFGIGFADKLTSLPDGALMFKIDTEDDDKGNEHVIADILYYYVKEESRRKNIGVRLFIELINICKSAGIEAIRADVPFGEEYDLCGYVLELFGFSFFLTERFEIETNLSELKKETFLRERKGSKIVPLRDILQREFKEWIKGQENKGNLTGRKISTDIMAYDNDVSAACMIDNSVAGLFLIKKEIGGELRPVLLKGDDRVKATDINDMLVTAYEAACLHNDSDTHVVIKVYSDIGCAMISRLFPEKSPYIIRRGYFYLEVNREGNTEEKRN